MNETQPKRSNLRKLSGLKAGSSSSSSSSSSTRLSVDVQAYDKDAAEYRQELALTSPANAVSRQVPDEADSGRQTSLVVQLDDTEARYRALAAGSADLLTKLDNAVARCGQYDQLADQVGRTLSDVESLVDRCTTNGIEDTESGQTADYWIRLKAPTIFKLTCYSSGALG